MSPAADRDVLREVGPDEDNLNRTGELAARVGTHNLGHKLILANAEAHPAEVRSAQARPRDRFRSAFLNPDEVERLATGAWGDKLTVEGASVRGDQYKPDEAVVVVLFSVASGRTGRGVIPYDRFTDSADAYDDAVDRNAFDPHVIREDRIEYEKQIAKARAEARREAGKSRAERRAQREAEQEAAQPPAEETVAAEAEEGAAPTEVTFASDPAAEQARLLGIADDLEPGQGSGSGGAYTVADIKERAPDTPSE